MKSSSNRSNSSQSTPSKQPNKQRIIENHIVVTPNNKKLSSTPASALASPLHEKQDELIIKRSPSGGRSMQTARKTSIANSPYASHRTFPRKVDREVNVNVNEKKERISKGNDIVVTRKRVTLSPYKSSNLNSSPAHRQQSNKTKTKETLHDLEVNALRAEENLFNSSYDYDGGEEAMVVTPLTPSYTTMADISFVSDLEGMNTTNTTTNTDNTTNNRGSIFTKPIRIRTPPKQELKERNFIQFNIDTVSKITTTPAKSSYSSSSSSSKPIPISTLKSKNDVDVLKLNSFISDISVDGRRYTDSSASPTSPTSASAEIGHVDVDVEVESIDLSTPMLNIYNDEDDDDDFIKRGSSSRVNRNTDCMLISGEYIGGFLNFNMNMNGLNDKFNNRNINSNSNDDVVNNGIFTDSNNENANTESELNKRRCVDPLSLAFLMRRSYEFCALNLNYERFVTKPDNSVNANANANVNANVNASDLSVSYDDYDSDDEEVKMNGWSDVKRPTPVKPLRV